VEEGANGKKNSGRKRKKGSVLILLPPVGKKRWAPEKGNRGEGEK
jgi:hypothetical protein